MVPRQPEVLRHPGLFSGGTAGQVLPGRLHDERIARWGAEPPEVDSRRMSELGSRKAVPAKGWQPRMDPRHHLAVPRSVRSPGLHDGDRPGHYREKEGRAGASAGK